MAQDLKPIPEGYHTLTPHLVVSGGAQAIRFYKSAFAAQELSRMDKPGGKLMHAELKIGDSIFMLADDCDPHPGHEQNCSVSPSILKGNTASFYLYVENADEVFSRALKAGATQIMPVQEMFWGDRVGQLRDPFGHTWSVATHTRDLTAQQIDEEAKNFFSKMKNSGGS
ncbi:MAG: VOC family protein [Candidatus Omnitrophota bacterium]